MSALQSPRFKVGDSVRTVGIKTPAAKEGIVEEAIASTSGDRVYRYRVRFPDGTFGTFFGFELESTSNDPGQNLGDL